MEFVRIANILQCEQSILSLPTITINNKRSLHFSSTHIAWSAFPVKHNYLFCVKVVVAEILRLSVFHFFGLQRLILKIIFCQRYDIGQIHYFCYSPVGWFILHHDSGSVVTWKRYEKPKNAVKSNPSKRIVTNMKNIDWYIVAKTLWSHCVALLTCWLSLLPTRESKFNKQNLITVAFPH